MNQKDNPALIYYHILEEEQKIKKQIEELNKSLAGVSKLRASVNAGPVNFDEVVRQISKQSELNEIYEKTCRSNYEEDVMS